MVCPETCKDRSLTVYIRWKYTYIHTYYNSTAHTQIFISGSEPPQSRLADKTAFFSQLCTGPTKSFVFTLEVYSYDILVASSGFHKNLGYDVDDLIHI